MGTIPLSLLVLAALDVGTDRPSAIARATNEGEKEVSRVLRRLRLHGLATRKAFGRWLVTDAGRAHLQEQRKRAQKLTLTETLKNARRDP